MLITSDPHGHAKTLFALLKKAQPETSEKIVINGDLVDRGPSPYDIVEAAIKNGWDCTLGNHEKMMLDGIRKGRLSEVVCWHQNGGSATDEDYRGRRDGLERHLDWMAKLPTYLSYDVAREDGRCLLVSHAGLYRVDDESDSDNNFVHWRKAAERLTKNGDILWHRDPIHDYAGIFQVIGHTPQYRGPRIEPHYANIDTGCYAKREGFGLLTAIRWPQMEIFQQENIG